MGFRASERNLERLAALLLFAELDFKVEEQTEPTGPLPWENPNICRRCRSDLGAVGVHACQCPPQELEIDYEVVRRGVGKLLLRYVEERGQGDPAGVKQILAEYGATGLSSIPQDKLLAVHDELEARLK